MHEMSDIVVGVKEEKILLKNLVPSDFAQRVPKAD